VAHVAVYVCQINDDINLMEFGFPSRLTRQVQLGPLAVIFCRIPVRWPFSSFFSSAAIDFVT